MEKACARAVPDIELRWLGTAPNPVDEDVEEWAGSGTGWEMGGSSIRLAVGRGRGCFGTLVALVFLVRLCRPDSSAWVCELPASSDAPDFSLRVFLLQTNLVSKILNAKILTESNKD